MFTTFLDCILPQKIHQILTDLPIATQCWKKWIILQWHSNFDWTSTILSVKSIFWFTVCRQVLFIITTETILQAHIWYTKVKAGNWLWWKWLNIHLTIARSVEYYSAVLLDKIIYKSWNYKAYSLSGIDLFDRLGLLPFVVVEVLNILDLTITILSITNYADCVTTWTQWQCSSSWKGPEYNFVCWVD
jgi:hypothetical protein